MMNAGQNTGICGAGALLVLWPVSGGLDGGSSWAT
jgi:hypothetical protein